MSNARTLANTINSSSQIVVPSGGIQFADATNANTPVTQSNLIEQDGYEEGAFTTTCSSAGYTISAQHSRYVKIGSLVQINAYVNFSAVNAASNSSVTLGGLPFTSISFNGGLYYTGVAREDSVKGDIFVIQQIRGSTTWSFNSMDGVQVNSNEPIVAGRGYSLSITYQA